MTWKSVAHRYPRNTPAGSNGNAGLLEAATLADSLAEKNGRGGEINGPAIAFQLVAATCLGAMLVPQVMKLFPDLKQWLVGNKHERA
jgi:hypothetical protein